MRLLTKTTLYFFAAMALLLLLTGVYLFRQFNRQINDRSDRDLLAEEQAWVDYLQTSADAGTTFILRTREVAVYPVNAPETTSPVLQNTTQTNMRTGMQMPYRELQQVVNIGDINYQIIIRKSQEQKALLVAGFTRVMLLVLLGLCAFTLLVNWLISRNLWAPFYNTLYKIRHTELNRIHTVKFEQTAIREFTELNNSLGELRDKIHRDYINTKEFTENAAHEMQTPIAVVQGKLELLLQSPHLQEAEIQSIADAADTLSRLARLNQGLLLLSKIDNNQYLSADNINFVQLTKKYLRVFDEMIRDKNLQLQQDFSGEFVATLHPVLADSLLANLLGNAIKYNYTGGWIRITISNHQFEIANSSRVLPIPADKQFMRFSSAGSGDESSNGLGLAIAKKIADANGLILRYRYAEGSHVFTLEKSG